MDADIATWAGPILQTLVMAGTVGALIVRLHTDMKLLIQQVQQTKSDVYSLKEEMKKLAQVMIDLARQDTRLTNLEARMHELIRMQLEEKS